jgi:DNA-binding transcriptional LysR family regulator
MLKRLHIRQFLAVVDAGNISRAARRINVTQPTLSTGIAELERLVGSPLFIRERRQVRLTDAGSQFLGVARTIEDDFQSAEMAIGSITASAQPVNFGLLASLPTQLYSDIVQSSAIAGATAIFEGSDTDIRKRLGQGKLDLAITLLRPDDLLQTSKALYQEDYLLFLPAAHPMASKEVIHPAEIAAETMIARRSCELLRETSRFFTQRGIRPSFSFKSTNDDRCIEMVRAGIGITTAPASLARHGIVTAKLADYDYQRTIGLLFSSEWLAIHGLDDPLIAACVEGCKPLF